MPSADGDAIKRIFDRVKGNRGTWDSHWQLVARYCFPDADDFYQRAGQTSRGERKNQYVYDSTAILSLDRFAGILESLVTPMQQQWHNLRTTLTSISRDRDVRMYFDEVTSILFEKRYAAKSGFQGQMHAVYKSIGAFGNGIMYVEEADDNPGELRYKSCFIGDTYIDVSPQSVVDTVFRRFDMTHEAAMRKFPDTIPDLVKKRYEQNRYEFDEYLHVVRPNLDFDPQRFDAGGMPYSSVYIHYKTGTVLSEGGYRTFPYPVARYSMSPTEIYGRGPAMEVLGDILTLQEMERTDLRATHKLVDPPLLMHDDGLLGGGHQQVNLNPGGLTPGGVNPDGRQLIHPLQTNARVDINEQKMERKRDVIRDSFLITLFQILVDTPRMSATEAMIRAQEKGALLGPGIARTQSELLGTLIERELDILWNAGQLPDPPPALIDSGGDFDIQYQSPINRLMRKEEAIGTQTVLDAAVQIVNATGDPRHMRRIDPDEMLQLIADSSGAPTRILRSDQEIAAMDAAEQQQQQLQQEVAAAPQLAKAAKDFAQAQNLRVGA